jgi:hypothetical protein
VEPHHFDTDADSTYHPDVDPNSDFYLLRILIRFFTLRDPDPDPGCQLKAKTLGKVLKYFHIPTFLLVICKLMRIRIRLRIQLITLMQIGCGSAYRFLFDADPDPTFTLMRNRIQILAAK